MNVSLRGQLFSWLAGSIVLAGGFAAVLSFALAFADANELQDAQLSQVAEVLSQQRLPVGIDHRPRTAGDPETRYVIERLGVLAPTEHPTTDLPLPESLRSGLQTIEWRGVRWRALVTQNATGERFAVAQRMSVRDEAALDSALLTLVPLLVMVPVLLLIVGLVLRHAFAGMLALSAEVDALDGRALRALDERHVPRESLPLLQAINRLMHRLEQAQEQQRRLVSDAAHELRTPVAALILQADNVEHLELSRDARSRMASLRQGLTRMSR